MKLISISLMIILVTTTSCVYVRDTMRFQEEFDKETYHQIAKAKGIKNEKWIERLYRNEVNISNFDKFKKQGVDLTQVYDKSYKYKSWALFTEIILEGEILSKKENPESNVKFRTEYLVKVKKVLKKMDWQISDTIKLKLTYGPIGDRLYTVSSAGDKYNVGEHLILYLEPMEKAFKSYEENRVEQEPASRIKINADRNDLNVYQPIKKYVIKEKDVYHKGKGNLGKKSKVFREIKNILSLNKIR